MSWTTRFQRTPAVDLPPLIEAVANGDARAVEPLLLKLDPLIRAQVKAAYWIPQRERDDTASVVTGWLWEDLEMLCRNYQSEQGGPVGYFYRIIGRLVARHNRHLNTHKVKIGDPEESLDDPDEIASHMKATEGPSVVDQLEGEDLKGAIRHWLSMRLPEDREVFEQRLLDGNSSQEVATRLGRNTAWVDKKVQRLREELHEWLSKRGLLVWAALSLWYLTRSATGAALVRHGLSLIAALS